MPCDIVVGLQWGDEGKGKIVDRLSEDYHYVVRYQGGSNAGHTVYDENDNKFVLHLIPTGVLRGKIGIITHGCVVNPDELAEEIKLLEDTGFDLRDKLFISQDAHVTTQEHLYEDEVNKLIFGSTGKGIGPTYRDKADRSGIRLRDIDHEIISPYVCDTRKLLYDNFDKWMLFEGAQAMGLDIDMGTYPFVTSSPCTANYAPQGSGLPLSYFGRSSVIGVVKAYSTRVAVGPFPSEITTDLGDKLRERGQEYGATTGRPRRIGWLDLEQLKLACEINGITQIALTKTDVLANFGPVLVRESAEKTTVFDPWSLNGATKYEQLDDNLKKYIEYIEQYLDVTVSMIGTGPRRDQLIYT